MTLHLLCKKTFMEYAIQPQIITILSHLLMARVHRRPKTKYWQCQFCDAGGKWRRVSTRLTDKAAATRWCTAMQDAADAISRGSATEAQMRRLISEQMKKVTGKGL